MTVTWEAATWLAAFVCALVFVSRTVIRRRRIEVARQRQATNGAMRIVSLSNLRTAYALLAAAVIGGLAGLLSLLPFFPARPLIVLVCLEAMALLLAIVAYLEDRGDRALFAFLLQQEREKAGN